jgi:hypothetical protein
MASKTTLSAKNLEALGVEHLAALLMEISEGNANAKRRLRLELAGSESPDKLANEIRKRLTAIGAATTNVGWRTLKGFRGDLNTQRRLIVEQVLKAAPADAADLMWQFIALGDAVIERTSDASGGVSDVFREACQNIATILAETKSQPQTWLPNVAALVLANSYGQNDGLVGAVAPLLDKAGLEQLRSMLMAAAKDSAPATSSRSRPAKRWRKRVLAASEALRKRPRGDSLRVALLAIADALGDVDAYIALMADAYMPAVAAQIADRLLKAGRPQDALKALDGARLTTRFAPPAEWVDVRIAIFEALGRKDEAQTVRLDRFRQTLEAAYLRAYLKRLPDFDDIEAEDAWLDWAKAFPDANAAMALLIGWPSFERAADLVMQRATEMDGNAAETLTHAADRLSSRYPFAALLLHRQIVEASLMGGREQAQAAAALPYLEAESLARHVDDFGRYDAHSVWFKKLEKLYGRRTAFWKALP